MVDHADAAEYRKKVYNLAKKTIDLLEPYEHCRMTVVLSNLLVFCFLPLAIGGLFGWFIIWLAWFIFSTFTCGVLLEMPGVEDYEDPAKKIGHKLITDVPFYLASVFTLQIFALRKIFIEFEFLSQEAGALTIGASTKTFLLPLDQIQDLEIWPKHEDALQMGILKEIDLQDLNNQVNSHKWDGDRPDTHDSDVLRQIRMRAFLKTFINLKTEYVWFDYSCVPQDDVNKRIEHLKAVPSIVARSKIQNVHGNRILESAYFRSVWCQLESLGADLHIPSPDGTLTISNPSDLYSILPGFIEMACSSKYRGLFLQDPGRAETILTILRMFIKHHDELAFF